MSCMIPVGANNEEIEKTNISSSRKNWAPSPWMVKGIVRSNGSVVSLKTGWSHQASKLWQCRQNDSIEDGSNDPANNNRNTKGCSERQWTISCGSKHWTGQRLGVKPSTCSRCCLYGKPDQTINQILYGKQTDHIKNNIHRHVEPGSKHLYKPFGVRNVETGSKYPSKPFGVNHHW